MSSNKFKQLTKKTAKLSVTALAVIGCFGGLYAGVLLYSGSVETQKAEAEKKRSDDEAQLTSFSGQMEKSTVAEKRFAALQENRVSTEYTLNNLDAFKEWLKVSKERFKLDGLQLTPAAEIETDKQELKNFPYKISLRPKLKVNFRAVSDMHVFSFMNDMVGENSGFMRIEHLEIRRKGDMDEGILKQLHDGATTILVDAKIEVTNIGISKVDEKAAKAAAATAGAPGAPGAPPAMPGAPR